MLVKEKPIGCVSRMWADNTYSRFTDSLVELMMYSQRALCKDEEYIDYNKAGASYHFLARNQLARESVGEWLLMLDTDHQFAPDLLVRLLDLKKRTGAMVVCGIYQIKIPPHRPLANIWGENNAVIPLANLPKDTYEMQVGPMPGGCMLIDRKVFYILSQLFPDNEPFDQIGKMSEDYSFCLRCKQAGIPIILGPQIESHHLITTALSMEDYIPPAQTRSLILENATIKTEAT